jgi:hypothetical protein
MTDQLHFHSGSLCLNCGERRIFSTPIPSVLVLSEHCRACGWCDCVGAFAFRVCVSCVEAWLRDVKLEARDTKRERVHGA